MSGRRKMWLLLAIVATLLVLGKARIERSLLYLPRPRPPGPLPAGWEPIDGGYLVRRSAVPPARVVIVFGGNATIASDWAAPVERLLAARPDTAIALVEYPGYGGAPGSPSRSAILAALPAFRTAAARTLALSEADLDAKSVFFAHSLGAAVALEWAVLHPPRRIVLAAPFLSIEAMARRMIGRPVSFLAGERFSNVARLRELAASSPPPVDVFHGERDEVVPVAMGRELAAAHPAFVRYHELPDADHASVAGTAFDTLLSED